MTQTNSHWTKAAGITYKKVTYHVNPSYIWNDADHLRS
jgi:hypothetical protein